MQNDEIGQDLSIPATRALVHAEQATPSYRLFELAKDTLLVAVVYFLGVIVNADGGLSFLPGATDPVLLALVGGLAVNLRRALRDVLAKRGVETLR